MGVGTGSQQELGLCGRCIAEGLLLIVDVADMAPMPHAHLVRRLCGHLFFLLTESVHSRPHRQRSLLVEAGWVVAGSVAGERATGEGGCPSAAAVANPSRMTLQAQLKRSSQVNALLCNRGRVRAILLSVGMLLAFSGCRRTLPANQAGPHPWLLGLAVEKSTE